MDFSNVVVQDDDGDDLNAIGSPRSNPPIWFEVCIFCSNSSNETISFRTSMIPNICSCDERLFIAYALNLPFPKESEIHHTCDLAFVLRAIWESKKLTNKIQYCVSPSIKD